MSGIAPLDMTLDELRDALAPLLPAEAAFDGWGDVALAQAALALGVPADRARLALPGGPVALIDAWFASIDLAMARALPADRLAGMKIRARIQALVMARIEAVAPHSEAVRRAIAILALPQNTMAGARLGWRAADRMWRLAGDTATGFAHYSEACDARRGLWRTTLLALLDDESEELADTRAFLARRIEGVMRFEKLKAQLRPDPERQFNVTRFLGRLRYPAR